ncbi:FadR/GntR family transcriptional regulator [Amphritea pacifica]|uniref:FadR family transcriptional regulator n=1 Tax=Amphritea pacifica TaxID=2811233 RepID=A0ABS2W886_9GAMM|nr:GntR family transcriptional regulator [Amphritea pacifica]MBN0987801.1 FadR family transcriptional regulator [Amphritea pacifica]MBN1008078.1 FadR family transcriptional regulator [Amphritea pacifica]
MLWGLRPVEQQAAYGLAVDRLKRQIHMGLLLPGERLPAERKLAEEIGISRVTLREAFRILETERYISTKRGAHGGTFVADASILDDISGHRIALMNATIMRAMEFREANEKTAAVLACKRRTLPEIKGMTAALNDMNNAKLPGDFRRGITLFKLAMGAASHNHYINDAVEYGLTDMFFPIHILESEHNRPSLITIYQQLLQAIQDHDEVVAKNHAAALIQLDWDMLRDIQRVD